MGQLLSAGRHVSNQRPVPLVHSLESSGKKSGQASRLSKPGQPNDLVQLPPKYLVASQTCKGMVSAMRIEAPHLSVHCRVPVVLAWLSTLHTSYIVQRDGAAK